MKQGGCLCGQVRYTLSGDLPPAYACHCGECKKQTASAFSLSVVVARDRLDVVGQLRSFTRKAHSGAIKTCTFCPDCGTRLWNGSSASPDMVTLKVGTLDNSGDVAPRGHLWVSRKQAGIMLDPDVPTFDTQPEDLRAWREALR